MNVEVSPHSLRDALPGPSRARRRNRSFLFAVLVPTLLVFLYLIAVATPQYVTEFRFAAFADNSNPGNDQTANLNNLNVIAYGRQVNTSYDTDYIIADYFQSRQVIEDLRRSFNLPAMYKPHRFDPVFKFWWDNGTTERLFRYWKNFVIAANFDPTTGVATVSVRAFTPQDSLHLAQALAELGEKLANELTARPRRDALEYARHAYDRAEQRLQDALKQVASFRDKMQITDMPTEASSLATLHATLRQNLTTMQAQLASLGRSLGANAPALVTLRSEITATEDQIRRIDALRGSGTGTATKGLPTDSATYNFLEQFVQFAAAFRDAMDRHLEQARFDVEVQHQYMETFVKPTLPQAASCPKTFLWTAIAFVVLCILWAIGSLLYLSLRDHTE